MCYGLDVACIFASPRRHISFKWSVIQPREVGETGRVTINVSLIVNFVLLQSVQCNLCSPDNANVFQWNRK